MPCWSVWRAWAIGSSPAWTSAHRLPRRQSAEVIEHIENPGLFLAELARLLRPGGLALFTTPNLHSAQAKLLFALGDRLKQFDAKADPTHITPIVLFPFTRLLNRHGLMVLESWGFPLDGSVHPPRDRDRCCGRAFQGQSGFAGAAQWSRPLLNRRQLDQGRSSHDPLRMSPRKTALIGGITGQDGSYLAELLL